MISRTTVLLVVAGAALLLSLLLALASATWLADAQARTTLMLASAWFTGLLAVIYTALAIARPGDRAYPWFALASWAWALRFAVPTLLADAPQDIMELAVAALQTVFVTAAFMLALRLIDFHSGWLERVIMALASISLGAYVLATVAIPEVLTPVIDGARFVFRAFGLVITFLVLRALLRAPSPDLLTLMFSGVVLMLISFDSFWAGLFNTPLLDGRYQALATPVLGFTMAALLIIRFLHALTQAESANARLKAAVARTRAELAEQHRHVEHLVEASATQAERERIMRDVHDGVGGHLVAALTLLGEPNANGPPPTTAGYPGHRDAGVLRERLEAALLDLRLVIDSLEDVDGDVGSILGMLRVRLRPVLEASGIDGRWRLADLPEDARLSAQDALDLMRIIQETVTNVVRHAQAAQLEIEARGTTDGGLLIRIRDDGCGFAGRDPGLHGRGLQNMRRRAERLGGCLDVTTSAEGTRVTLELPLQTREQMPTGGPVT